VKRVFFIVGPTASGKSEIAAQVASLCNAEIVGVDAFQIYDRLRRLTAQPDASTLALVPHHLIGTFPPAEEMSAAKFGEMAADVISEIQSRGRNVIVVGGSGLYVRALSGGLSPLPPADATLREQLEELSLRELNVRLSVLDPASAEAIDVKNRRRVSRAVEICLLTGKRASEQRVASVTRGAGVFVFRDRADLYARIDLRVERMFADGVVEEIKAAGALGRTAEQALGLREIRQLLAGELAVPECITAIQQSTRRYAKRQLTWFRRQTTFKPLNLSHRSTAAAIELIAARARLSFAHD
jgi:tRNA dimethylallyltransferase